MQSKEKYQAVIKHTSPVVLFFSLIFILVSSSCSPSIPSQMDQSKDDVILTSTDTPEKLRDTLTPTITYTATLRPTETSTATATIIPTPGRCTTPMSLMLHSDYGAARMEELAKVIEENDLTTITYESLYEDYFFQGKCPPDETLLVSLDDPKPSALLPVFKEMIQVFIDHNMVLTIGIITREPHNPEAWEYFNSIQEKGIEIASHTVNHFDLTKLNEDEIQFELEKSYNHICDNTKRCPVSLTLPWGNYDDQVQRIAKEIGYLGFISVPGELYFGGEYPHTFKRIPPNYESQSTTLSDLRLHFQNW